MPENRFYINSSLERGQKVFLDPKEAHHVQVMRGEVGDVVELINGKHLLAQAKILSLKNKKVELVIESIEEKKSDRREFILCQALFDFSKIDLILQKGTELGISTFWLFPAGRSPKKEVNEHQYERMEALLLSATKQCGRLDLPTLHIKPSLEKWELLEAPAFYGSLDPSSPPFYSYLEGVTKLFFFIGPPSGFTENEEEEFKKRKVIGVRLSELILRSETAAIASAALNASF